MTYLNAYEILKQVRLGLDEYSEDLAQGVETDSAYSNEYLMQKINDAQRYIYHILFRRDPDRFLTSETASFSGSVYTLPWNYGKIHELRDENGIRVAHIKARQSKVVNQAGNDGLYYHKGNTLVLDKTGVTKDYTIWFYTKPRDIDQGRITASGSLSITLDTSAKKIADYYNGMTIENISSDWIDTIDDYTAARVATISETSLNIDDVYGIVPEVAEPFHFLIPMKSIIDIQMSHPLSMKNTSGNEMQNFNNQLIEVMSTFGYDTEDIHYSDMFNDFLPYSSSMISVETD
jgi:hypothetical protein